MPVSSRPPTDAAGRNVEAAVAALERRRGYGAYGLERGERQFGVWLRSERLGLSGKLDLLIVTAEACFPVDFKDTAGGVRANHRMQLAAYALLAEEAYDVRRGSASSTRFPLAPAHGGAAGQARAASGDRATRRNCAA